MVQIFFPFSKGLDLVLALGGCLIFSGYVLPSLASLPWPLVWRVLTSRWADVDKQ